MDAKRINLPAGLAFPVRVVEVHVAAGQRVAKGDPLYTLETAAGKRGMMRAPFSGEITEGPVALDSSFATATPVIGIAMERAEEPAEPAPADPSPAEARTAPGPDAGERDRDLSVILRQSGWYAETSDLATYRRMVAQRLAEKGHDSEAARTAAEAERVELSWHRLRKQADAPAPKPATKPKDTTPWGFGAGLVALIVVAIGGGLGGLAGRFLEANLPLNETIAYGLPGVLALAGTAALVIAVLAGRAGSLVSWVVAIAGCMLFYPSFMVMGPDDGEALADLGPAIEAGIGIDPTGPLLALVDIAGGGGGQAPRGRYGLTRVGTNANWITDTKTGETIRSLEWDEMLIDGSYILSTRVQRCSFGMTDLALPYTDAGTGEQLGVIAAPCEGRFVQFTGVLFDVEGNPKDTRVRSFLAADGRYFESGVWVVSWTSPTKEMRAQYGLPDHCTRVGIVHGINRNMTLGKRQDGVERSLDYCAK
ncbi:hypothetical protein [Oricola sp.]|uniref:hypothetical protein n=1 Tax=Oricola sp. TaxID=1979950 RepID=UPI0025FE1093|nr:hypothetical protein [Oricola sp.]MCI5077246.1 hypothetical protein [Oricola sp.]